MVLAGTMWVPEGGEPKALKFTICCMRARVPPESTGTITHIVSVGKYHHCNNKDVKDNNDNDNSSDKGKRFLYK